jgi:hypothetical protein
MSDLLSSASLLIAIVTVLYALWYSEIRTGYEDIKATANREDKKVSRVSRIIVWRALPLTAASFSLAVIFLKDAIAIVHHSWHVTADLKSRLTTYDAVTTTFVLVEIFCIFLAVLIAVQTVKLVINWLDLRGKPPVVD